MAQDPNTIVVLKGQALIYSIVEDTTTYKYRLNNGTIGDLTAQILPYLGLKDSDLPKVISEDVLLAGLDTAFATVANMTISLSKKADWDRTLSLVSIKANKQEITDLIAKVAYKDEMLFALNKKANLDEMVTAFDTKADRTNVYTIDEIHRLMMDFIGAACVENIATRNSLEYGMYPFVWVHDASADPDERVKSPALYKWIANSWFYLGTVGDFNTGSGGGLDEDALNRITSIESRLGLLEEGSFSVNERYLDGAGTEENPLTLSDSVRGRLLPDPNELNFEDDDKLVISSVNSGCGSNVLLLLHFDKLLVDGSLVDESGKCQTYTWRPIYGNPAVSGYLSDDLDAYEKVAYHAHGGSTHGVSGLPNNLEVFTVDWRSKFSNSLFIDGCIFGSKGTANDRGGASFGFTNGIGGKLFNYVGWGPYSTWRGNIALGADFGNDLLPNVWYNWRFCRDVDGKCYLFLNGKLLIIQTDYTYPLALKSLQLQGSFNSSYGADPGIYQQSLDELRICNTCESTKDYELVNKPFGSYTVKEYRVSNTKLSDLLNVNSTDCDARFGSGVTKENTATAQFLAHDARITSVENELGIVNQIMNQTLSTEFNVEG